MSYEKAIISICEFIAKGNEPMEDAAYRGLFQVDQEFAYSLRNTSSDPWGRPENLPNFFLTVQRHYSE
jgi:hypothetical protein